MTSRSVPIFNHHLLRSATGLVLAALSPAMAALLLGRTTPGAGAALLFALLWLPAVWLTDKYRHKYPQRYDSYLFASHLKAAAIMALGLAVVDLATDSAVASRAVLCSGLAVFVLADALLSIPRRRAGAARHGQAGRPAQPVNAAAAAPAGPPPPSVDAPAILQRIATELPGPLTGFVRENLPDDRGGITEVVAVDDMNHSAPRANPGVAGLLVGRTRLNDVRRLNQFLDLCADRIVLGGYLAVTYTPLEQVTADLRRRYPGPLYWPAYLAHFAWYRALPKIPWLDRLYFYLAPRFAGLDRLLLRDGQGRKRVLPKAEVWGRLAFWGFEVVAESEGEGDRCVLAQRVSLPVANRRPSFYAVVSLEKVGLDGKVIRLHKVRSMYPFSEFLQKRIHQSHGLTATGKFKNDFRLTEYGKLIRRNWIDELPGLFDWLHGDIKLVGMRATSPQFLSTYPPELYDLYIQIKPGLIPPIFDEKTDGFEQIVRIELAYLRRYVEAPIRTDIAYFWYTFRDIVFRKVRSH